jgi:hypothetical protein
LRQQVDEIVSEGVVVINQEEAQIESFVGSVVVDRLLFRGGEIATEDAGSMARCRRCRKKTLTSMGRQHQKEHDEPSVASLSSSRYSHGRRQFFVQDYLPIAILFVVVHCTIRLCHCQTRVQRCATTGTSLLAWLPSFAWADVFRWRREGEGVNSKERRRVVGTFFSEVPSWLTIARDWKDEGQTVGTRITPGDKPHQFLFPISHGCVLLSADKFDVESATSDACFRT